LALFDFDAAVLVVKRLAGGRSFGRGILAACYPDCALTIAFCPAFCWRRGGSGFGREREEERDRGEGKGQWNGLAQDETHR
jgi:hypothetical protein